jgi:hypothetical protein
VSRQRKWLDLRVPLRKAAHSPLALAPRRDPGRDHPVGWRSGGRAARVRGAHRAPARQGPGHRGWARLGSRGRFPGPLLRPEPGARPRPLAVGRRRASGQRRQASGQILVRRARIRPCPKSEAQVFAILHKISRRRDYLLPRCTIKSRSSRRLCRSSSCSTSCSRMVSAMLYVTMSLSLVASIRAL